VLPECPLEPQCQDVRHDRGDDGIDLGDTPVRRSTTTRYVKAQAMTKCQHSAQAGNSKYLSSNAKATTTVTCGTRVLTMTDRIKVFGARAQCPGTWLRTSSELRRTIQS
jgi:hypothetical protein